MLRCNLFQLKGCRNALAARALPRTLLTVLPRPLVVFWRQGQGQGHGGEDGVVGEVERRKGGEGNDTQQKFDKSSTGP